jgi:hypothetical protein
MKVQLLVFHQETGSSNTLKSFFFDLVDKLFGGCRRRDYKKRRTDSDEESASITIE